MLTDEWSTVSVQITFWMKFSTDILNDGLDARRAHLCTGWILGVDIIHEEEEYFSKQAASM